MNEIIMQNFNFLNIQSMFPELEVLKGIPQNPLYHEEGNVWIHTSMVCESLLKQKEWNSLSSEDKSVLYLAGLFHDIGKSVCTRVEDGVISSPHHGITGAKIFRSLFYRKYGKVLSLPFSIREKAAGLIRYHGLPLWFMERENMEYSLIKASYAANLRLLYILAKADLEGRICKDKEELFDKILCFKEYGEELHIFNEKKEFANPYTRYKYFNRELNWPDTVLYDPSEFEVIMMAGLPLSGKDTYIEEHFDSMPVVSLDDIREEFHLPPAKGSKKAVQIGRERAKEFLRKKEPFIWNATSLIWDNRKKLYDLFTSYKACVRVIYLESPYSKLLERNEIRDRSVPQNVIDRMLNHMDMVESFEAFKAEYVVKE